MLIIDENSLPHYPDLGSCEYVEIARQSGDDNSYNISGKRTSFQDRIRISKEFIKVRITNSDL